MLLRIYIKPADFDRHGHTEGFRGCTWLTNRLGYRVLYGEGCRVRMEKLIGEDETDDRTKKRKERFDHYLVQQVAKGDDRVGSAQDPRQGAQLQVPSQNLVILMDAVGFLPEEFNIGSQAKDEGGVDIMNQDAHELDDGPNISSERRMKSPVRAPATKRINEIHNEEPATKRSMID